MTRAHNQNSTPTFFGRSMLETLGPVSLRLAKIFSSQTQFEAKDLQTLKHLSKTHTLIYILPSSSGMDYFLLNHFLIEHGLPISHFANDVFFTPFQRPTVALKSFMEHLKFSILGKNEKHQRNLNAFVNCLENNRSFCIFLKDFKDQPQDQSFHQNLWETLLEKSKTQPLAFVPISFVWGRKSIYLKNKNADTQYQHRRSPTWIGSLLFLSNPHSRLYATFSAPLKTSELTKDFQSQTPQSQIKKLKRLFEVHFAHHSRALTGPPLQTRARVIRSILKEPELIELHKQWSQRKRKSLSFFEKKSQSILKEMVSDYSPSLVSVAYHIVKFLTNRLFDQVHIDGPSIEKLKQEISTKPVILLPSHRSHMDYILLSYSMYIHNMAPPHIAAGINLSFFPFGTFFRKTGAFFIRRSFSGDEQYSRLLFLYVRWLQRKGYVQEFFIEGGRSRTGKLLSPKLGLLSIEVDAFRSNLVDDVSVIPVSLSYSRVPDEQGFKTELTGQIKTKESFFSVFKSLHILSRKYGEAFVKFGTPISLKDLFEKHPSYAQHQKTEKQKVYELGIKVMNDLAQNTTVTPSAMIASSLLNQAPIFTWVEVLRSAKSLIEFLEHTPATLSPRLHALDSYEASFKKYYEMIRWMVKNEQGNLSVLPKHRYTLDYHKNMVLHFFLPAFVAHHPSELNAFETLMRFEFPSFQKPSLTTPPKLSPEVKLLFKSLIETYLFVATGLTQKNFEFSLSKINLKKVHEFAQEKQKNVQACIEAYSTHRIASAIEFFIKNDSAKKNIDGYLEEFKKVYASM